MEKERNPCGDARGCDYNYMFYKRNSVFGIRAVRQIMGDFSPVIVAGSGKTKPPSKEPGISSGSTGYIPLTPLIKYAIVGYILIVRYLRYLIKSDNAWKM